MRAAVMRDLNAPLVVEDVEIDDPGPHEVIVRTAAASVCHSDLSAVSGHVSGPRPAVLGHEASGVVAAVGALVTHVTEGDHVVTCLPPFCGQCSYCLTGRPAMCVDGMASRLSRTPSALKIDSGPVSQFCGLGAFAERMLVHEHSLVKVDERMPLDKAALLGCGVTTGLGAVFHTAAVRPGESVAVFGCGGVGLSIVQGARLAGARRIIAVDRIRDRLRIASELGATNTVEASGEPREVVERITGIATGGVDHAFEAVGSRHTAEMAFCSLVRGGTATIVGLVYGETIIIPGDHLMAERKLQGCALGSNRFRIDIPRYVDLYLQGRLLLDEMVTAVVSLEEINQALDALRDGAGARTVVAFD